MPGPVELLVMFVFGFFSFGVPIATLVLLVLTYCKISQIQQDLRAQGQRPLPKAPDG